MKSVEPTAILALPDTPLLLDLAEDASPEVEPLGFPQFLQNRAAIFSKVPQC
jgi:hypothetical protein